MVKRFKVFDPWVISYVKIIYMCFSRRNGQVTQRQKSLNTGNGMKVIYPPGLNKISCSIFPGGYRTWQIPEEGRRVQRLEWCGYNRFGLPIWISKAEKIFSVIQDVRFWFVPCTKWYQNEEIKFEKKNLQMTFLGRIFLNTMSLQNIGEISDLLWHLCKVLVVTIFFLLVFNQD